MPWFVVPAAVAIGGLVGKLVARRVRGQDAVRAIEDPPGVRTIARFELAPEATADSVLLAVAAELARDLDPPIEVIDDAVRARPHPLAQKTDVVRLARRDPASGAYTLELTRAWTGAALGDDAFAVLRRVHDALEAHPGVGKLAWHARQDRAFADGYAMPVLVQHAIVP
jgi:hypothetical protein